MSCKGKCILFQDTKNKPDYVDGFVTCIECETTFKHKGIFCPCCGYRIRNKARYGRKKNHKRIG